MILIMLLLIFFSFSDPHSDILDASMCLGTTVLNCALSEDWLPVNASTNPLEQGPVTMVYHIKDGDHAWVRIMVENGGKFQYIRDLKT